MENVLACFLFKLIFALSWLEIWHKRSYCQWENLFTHVYQKLKKRINSEILDEKKMSKAIEGNK